MQPRNVNPYKRVVGQFAVVPAPTGHVASSDRIGAITQKLRHVAIIPDGNRRWARLQGLPPEVGHRHGFLEVSPTLLTSAWQHGIHTITLWLFSTENWQRPDREVQNLMSIYEQFLTMMLPIAQHLSVRMHHLGRKDRIPPSLLRIVEQVEAETSACTDFIFNIALDYGGRDEIVRAMRKLMQLSPGVNDIDERLLDNLMDLDQQPFPYPDLIIRTSGEIRSSGFMSWQSCYSELYFTDKCYPDFTWEDFQAAITSFLDRTQRFGK